MTLRTILLGLSIPVFLILQTGASCASSDGGYKSTSHRGDDQYSQTERPNRIPRNSDLVREGAGDLRWRADLDGEIYVYDEGARRIVYNGPIQRDQNIRVDPDHDQIRIDDRVVYKQNLHGGNRHQIWFVRERLSGSGGQGGQQPPHGAREMANGRGDLAINEAPQKGRVYVYDNDARRVIYSTDISRGNSFQIFPHAGYVNLNSKRHATVRFPHGHYFTLYFDER